MQMSAVELAWFDPFDHERVPHCSIVSSPTDDVRPSVTAVDLEHRSFDDDFARTAGWSDEERRRIHAFASVRDAHRHLVGRWTMKRIAALVWSVTPEDVQFKTSLQGKPTPFPKTARPDAGGCRPSALHLNVAHSGRYVVVAVHRSARVGIDVEVSNTNFDAVALARRYLPRTRAAEVEDAVDEDRHRAFLERWCEFEARSKALGMGVHILGEVEPLRRAVQATTVYTVTGLDGATCVAAVVRSDIGSIDDRAESRR